MDRAANFLADKRKLKAKWLEVPSAVEHIGHIVYDFAFNVVDDDDDDDS